MIGRLLSARYPGKEHANAFLAAGPLDGRQQGGGHPAVLREQHVVGAAGRAGIHCFERDPPGFEPSAQAGGDRNHAASKPEQQQFDTAMLDDPGEAVGGQRCRRPQQCPVGEAFGNLRNQSDQSNFSPKSLLRPAYYVPESKKVDQLFAELQNQRVHIAIIVDEYGGTAGLVTIEDLLEEITTLTRGGQLGDQGSGTLDDPPGTGKSGPEDPTGEVAAPSIKNYPPYTRKPLAKGKKTGKLRR